jgi:hypothetical protein
MALFDTIYPPRSISILKTKKKENVTNLLAALALFGSSTTRDMAEFVLFKNQSAGQKSEENRNNIKRLGSEYNRLLNGRAKYRHRKNKDDRHPGTISEGYVRVVGKYFNGLNHIPVYFLTLKGSFLVMGFNFNEHDLPTIIQNLARNSLYFAYINSILKKTSLQLVKELFIDPLRVVLEKTKFFLEPEMQFYFANIAEQTGLSLRKKMAEIAKQRDDEIVNRKIDYESVPTLRDIVEHPSASIVDHLFSNLQSLRRDESDYREYLRNSGVESVLDLTFYYAKPNEDWADSLIEYYYADKESEEFYRENYDSLDWNLVYKVMEVVHRTYHLTFGDLIPAKPRYKLPRSKRWKKHMRYKKSSGKF